MRVLHKGILFGLLLLIWYACAVSGESPETWWSIGRNELQTTLETALRNKVAKNVVVFVGDGMGLATISAARILKGQLIGRAGEESALHFENFPHTGLLKPYSNNMQVSESSASGTALFTGQKVNSETIGLNSNATPKQCKNSSLHHIDGLMLWAQQAGKATGIVTNTRVADSTPASLYAHSADEDWEADADIPVAERDPSSCKDISRQLIEDLPGKNINVILGGGRRKFLSTMHVDQSTGMSGVRLDGRNLIQEWITEKRQRNTSAAYVENKHQLKDVPNDTEYLFGMFNPELMSYALDRGTASSEPSLSEMATKAVRLLSGKPNGFFLVVEGGLIDDAHHRSLAAKALHETLEMDKAIEAVDTLTEDDDTLLVAVADHSHSLIFLGYQSRGSPILGLARGRTSDGKPYTSLLYASGPTTLVNGSRENITGHQTDHKDYHQQALIPGRWGMHMGEDVPMYAKGPLSHIFTGVKEQHYIAHAVNYAACYRNDTLTVCGNKK